MDFEALQTEFYARGFDYLNDGGAGATRAKRWLNLAMHEIDGLEDWPYLQASTTGTAPLSIADLRTVESVVDTTNESKLRPRNRRDVSDADPSLDETGTPTHYYLSSGTTVNVYPANTSVSLQVRYWKVRDDLSATTDTPLMPARFRYAIVDYAAARAYADSDNPDMAAASRAEGDRLVGLMREVLLVQQHDLPDYITVTRWDDC